MKLIYFAHRQLLVEEQERFSSQQPCIDISISYRKWKRLRQHSRRLVVVPLPAFQIEMSGRRRQMSRQSNNNGSRITDEQIADLLFRLRDLLPEAHGRSSRRVSASKVLQETCNHIRSLHREVDDLSERLLELLATTETSSAQAAIIRSLLL